MQKNVAVEDERPVEALEAGAEPDLPGNVLVGSDLRPWRHQDRVAPRSWTVLVVEGQPVAEGFGAFQQVWGDRGPAPAITVAFVAGLGNPAWLCEINAIAVVDAQAEPGSAAPVS